ncbi:unnamed protein product [Bursaphelenchus okinawaensis]|uniref:ZP domain-containing protein n=1 Tax=Bursaphelenchus okinawaensis TaxID=465554 RepID=A0A811JSW2_9BILA|nr:unnamed protein product [Bursaphelenchus okinawaensis]CAG9082189.1 unnamed protein product [Bursaphelenchus okinawaensis]
MRFYPLICLFFSFSLAIKIENQIIGEPNIYCAKDEIRVVMYTTKAFTGTVYVKGHYDELECRHEYLRNPQTELAFTVPFGSCGMERRYEVNTSMTFDAILVVKFHSQFLTKHDKAFDIQCHFDRSPQNVTSNVVVADLEIKPMMHDTAPNKCEYTLRSETVDGPLIQKTNIGSKMVHRWQCNDPDQKILVKNCMARGDFEEAQIIDNRGCPMSDEFPSLTYSSETTMAFVAVDVFRFSDQEMMRFECQLEFCSGHSCVGVTPPNCPNVYPPEFNPSSVILESSDTRHETQVYGVFDEPFRKTTPSMVPVPPSNSHKPLFPLPEGKPSRPVGWERRKDQPLFTEVKSAHQTTNDVYLYCLQLLKKDKVQAATSPNLRPRRDEGRVRNIRSETILVGNYSSSFVDTGIRKAEICWERTEAVALIYVAVLLAVYSAVLTVYITYDMIRTKSRSGKAFISS